MCSKMAGILVIALGIVWLGSAWAAPLQMERADIEQDCWRLAPFDDVIFIMNSWKHRGPKEAPWDFGILARWEGRLPNGTLLYELEGGGKGVEVPSDDRSLLNLVFANDTIWFGRNPFIRLVVSVTKETLEGRWALDGFGAHPASYILGGTFVPVECPIGEAAAVASMRFGAEVPAGSLTGQAR